MKEKNIMKIENTIKEEIAKLLAKDEFLSYDEAKYYAIIEHQKNKSKFFALYFDQMVYVIDYNDKPIVYRNFGNRADEQMKGMYKDAYLLLTPLSQISDEDAIEVAELFDLGHLSGAVKSLVKSLLESLENNSQATTMFIRSWIKVVDYLRSRGYYIGDGTEIEYGWAVLKTK